MTSILAISGASGSGKTTLIELLLSIFRRRGIAVGALKHTPHEVIADKTGSDTDRMVHAGALSVGRATAHHTILIEPRRADESLNETAHRLFRSTCRIVLIEGGKSYAGPKIEVVRRNHTAMPMCDPDHVIAYVTDLDCDLPAPRLPLDDPEQTADFIEAWSHRVSPETILLVDDRPVECNEFVRTTLTDVIHALSRNLRGVTTDTTLTFLVPPTGHTPAIRLMAGSRRIGIKPFVARLLSRTLRGLVSTLDKGPQDDEGFTLTFGPPFVETPPTPCAPRPSVL